VWDEHAERFLDPATGVLLPTWDEALDDLAADPAAQPAHVVRFGQQVDYKGIVADSDAKVGKAIGYLTKYLGKVIGETYGDDPAELHPAQLDHLNRIHEHVKVLPCSPACANWLVYGVTPKDADGAAVPGECDSKAHDRQHLGLGGRRVLVSRQWTCKTLTDHRADRAEVIRQTLEAAGVDMDDQAALSVTQTTGDDGQPRFIWTPIRPGDEDAPTPKEVLPTASPNASAGASNTSTPNNAPATAQLHRANPIRQLRTQQHDRRPDMKREQVAETVVRLWSLEEVSAFLNIPKATLYQWGTLGYGPVGARIGRYVRYDPDAVRQWVKEQEAA
jgi:predicted DNA-binding transcriptional regulator AlpA